MEWSPPTVSMVVLITDGPINWKLFNFLTKTCLLSMVISNSYGDNCLLDDVNINLRCPVDVQYI